jgi:lysozyme family protein
MARTFRKDIHPITARWEGGWSDHKDDPGGKTMFGWTQATLQRVTGERWPEARMRAMTPDDALSLYERHFFREPNFHRLPPGFALSAYDAGVNSGQERASKWVQRGLGVTADGKVGSKTVQAAWGCQDPVTAIEAISKARLSFMQGLAIWKTFGRGWGRRVADVNAHAVLWATEALHGGAIVEQRQTAAEDRAKAKANQAGGTAVTGTGASGAGYGAEVPEWLLTAIAVATLAAVAVLIWKRWKEKRLAEGYSAVLKEVK